MEQTKIAKKALAVCHEFNAKYPVHTKGIVTRDDGSKIETYIKYPAQLIGESAVIFLKGISGAYLLERFKPDELPGTETLRDKVKNAIESAPFKNGDLKYHIVDAVFDVLGITKAQQDIEGACVVVNPYVLISAESGIVEVLRKSPDIRMTKLDYDLGDEPEREKPDPEGNICYITEYPQEAINHCQWDI